VDRIRHRRALGAGLPGGAGDQIVLVVSAMSGENQIAWVEGSATQNQSSALFPRVRSAKLPAGEQISVGLVHLWPSIPKAARGAAWIGQE